MDDKDLIFPRETIKHTLLGGFLHKYYLNCLYLAKNNADKVAKAKPTEIKSIWRKTFIEGQNAGRIKRRNEIIKDLPICTLIDENVFIGEGIIDALFPRIPDAYFIVDSKVLPILKKHTPNQDRIFTTDSMDGAYLKKIISIIKTSKVPFLVGIGGGRVMDYLKYVMMHTKKFCVAIPTSLTTHVYASPKIHVLPAIAELGEKRTIDGPVPDIAVLDMPFLEKLQKDNPRLIRAGLGDLMACITAIPDWELAEKHGAAKVNCAVADMAQTIIATLEKIDTKKKLSEWIEDYSFVQVLLCRISGWVGSAPVSGSEHLFALAAEHDFVEPPLHGELVALGTLIMAYIQKGDYKSVHMLMKRLDLPTSLSEIGISPKQASDALYFAKKEGLKKGRFTILNTLEMDRHYCGKVVKSLLKEGAIQE